MDFKSMNFREIIGELEKLFNERSRAQKIIIGSTVVVTIAFIVFIVLYSNQKKDSTYKVLFEKLSKEDASLIVQELEKDKIDYKIRDSGIIEVPENMVYKQRIKLAGMGLPKDSRVGFELFDKQEFGATDFDQKVKLTRALEGELARTIEVINAVNSAKVHIAMPKESLFVSKQIPPTASVTIEVVNNMSLNRRQIIAIKNIVSSSVPKMTRESVKVVDSQGYPLGEDDEISELSEEAKLQLKYKKNIENEMEKKIVGVLAPFLGGEDRVVSKVTIDFDFSKKNQTSEKFDPENVVRSEQSLEEKREGFRPKEIGGVPGAVSNIGPVEGIENQNIGETYSKNEIGTNYEVSKIVSTVKGEFATVKKMTASVVVDGKYEKVEGSGVLYEIKYIPLENDIIQSLESLVRNAIGIDENRGDSVTVANLQFEGSGDYMEEKDPLQVFIEKAIMYAGPIWPIMKYILVVVILYIMFQRVIRPFAVQMLEVHKSDEEEAKKLIDLDEDEDDDIVEKMQALKKKVQGNIGYGDEFDEDSIKHDVLIERIKEAIETKTEEVAILFDNLVSEDVRASAEEKFGRK